MDLNYNLVDYYCNKICLDEFFLVNIAYLFFFFLKGINFFFLCIVFQVSFILFFPLNTTVLFTNFRQKANPNTRESILKYTYTILEHPHCWKYAKVNLGAVSRNTAESVNECLQLQFFLNILSSILIKLIKILVFNISKNYFFN